MTSGNIVCDVTKHMFEKYGGDYGLELAKRGVIVVCPDPVGFGERMEISSQGDSFEKFQSSSCYEFSKNTIALGFSLAGIMVYEGIHLINFIYKCFGDGWAARTIGFPEAECRLCILAAVDERITGTIVSGYFYGFKESLFYMNNNCMCNYFPGIFIDFDMANLTGLVVPINLIIQTAKNDHLNGCSGFDNVVHQIDEANRMYSLYGKTVVHDIVEGDHAFHKELLNLL